MSDILKGLTGASPVFLFAWAVPSAIAVSVFALLVFPAYAHLAPEGLIQLSDTELGVVLAFASLLLAVVLNAASTPLYRILEGYLFPAKVRDWGAGRQLKRKASLEEKFPGTPEGWRKGLIYERLQRFPAAENQIAPTALGNAIRAFETYGTDHFELNSQVLWTELYAVIPDSMRKEVDQSRAGVDFFVASLYLSFILAVLGVIGLWANAENSAVSSGGLLATSVIAVGLVPLSYRWAIVSTSYWSYTVRAMVNVGRKELALTLGFRLPEAMDEERMMWRLISQFVLKEYDAKIGDDLNQYRMQRDVGHRGAED